jgi:hypothetical protein
VVNLSCSILIRISTFGQIFWVGLVILGIKDMNLLFDHFYFFFKCPITFAFSSVSSRELLFPLKGRGNWRRNWCLTNDDKNKGHWDENENWHLNCPLWFLNDLLWLRVLFPHKRKPNIYWDLLRCQDEWSFSE